ncbi:hypothetical protein K438DRAFT_1462197, partial [Mycena galopus ATCC 62051]
EWLLLFDNADDPNIDLFPFFPRCTHGNIIITSRNPELVVHGPRSYSKIGDMDENSAIDLLLMRAARDKTAENMKMASEIVKELTCLPLAIIQAGAYVSKFNCLHQYLSIYRQNHAKLLNQHPAQSHDDYTRQWTVYTTWQISFERLSKVAAQFLHMCSLLHYAGIPEAIFEQAVAWEADNHEDVETVGEAQIFLKNIKSVSGTWDPQRFLEILWEIQGYSLIDREGIGETLTIHPLVHSWCRSTLKDEVMARETMIDII